tara:strand:+ start:199 stop:369 length:171 start_codon:yes stop_codon:yes gene_type:complete
MDVERDFEAHGSGCGQLDLKASPDVSPAVSRSRVCEGLLLIRLPVLEAKEDAEPGE